MLSLLKFVIVRADFTVWNIFVNLIYLVNNESHFYRYCPLLIKSLLWNIDVGRVHFTADALFLITDHLH